MSLCTPSLCRPGHHLPLLPTSHASRRHHTRIASHGNENGALRTTGAYSHIERVDSDSEKFPGGNQLGDAADILNDGFNDKDRGRSRNSFRSALLTPTEAFEEVQQEREEPSPLSWDEFVEEPEPERKRTPAVPPAALPPSASVPSDPTTIPQGPENVATNRNLFKGARAFIRKERQGKQQAQDVPKKPHDFEIWRLDGGHSMRDSMASSSSVLRGSRRDSSGSVKGSNNSIRIKASEVSSVPTDETNEEEGEVMGGTSGLIGGGTGGSWWEISSPGFRVSEQGRDNYGAGSADTRGASPQEVISLTKEPVYEVLQVSTQGTVRHREVSRRQLLRHSGLTQRDIRRIDPSLWVTNAMPALLVRESALLLNLGSLRAISTAESVLVFDYASVGAQSFLHVLLDRLRLASDAYNGRGTRSPFELEVVEAALVSRTQRLESALLDIEPRVLTLLEVLPNQITADNLEELRLSKQALVELVSKVGALRHMLLELLEHAGDLRRISAIGRHCRVNKDGVLDCPTPVDQRLAEEEEQEVELLLEYYLQRCDSCHGQAEKLLDSAKEMEDSIAVNLSSRRLEVNRLELLLELGTFAAALGALVAGIFGMNLRSRLEESALAFWLTAGGILMGAILLFLAMLVYLVRRRIL